MLATFDRPVDPGLIAWAAEYLNERLVGHALGSRMLHQRLIDESLGYTERAFLERLAPAFLEDPSPDAKSAIYVGGAGRLIAAGQRENLVELNELLGLLERRVALLRVLRSVLSAPEIHVRIGGREPRYRDAVALGRRRGLRAGAAQARGGVRDRAGADGLPWGDLDGEGRRL